MSAGDALRGGTLAVALLVSMVLYGCATTIAEDTKLSLKGPKAEVSRKF